MRRKISKNTRLKHENIRIAVCGRHSGEGENVRDKYVNTCEENQIYVNIQEELIKSSK